jgi:hypothetical protein
VIYGDVGAARLHVIKADVLASFSRHRLTLAEIAVRHSVSPRYVQMLFESEGLTFSQSCSISVSPAPTGC